MRAVGEEPFFLLLDLNAILKYVHLLEYFQFLLHFWRKILYFSFNNFIEGNDFAHYTLLHESQGSVILNIFIS